MKRVIIYVISLVLFIGTMNAQKVNELTVQDASLKYEPVNAHGYWDAPWITNSDIFMDEYNVVLFRRNFELEAKPDTFIIHISADNKFELFINNELISMGPGRGDVTHYRYQTINIAPFLQQGKNTIATKVINYGQERMKGWVSNKTAFILQGHSTREAFLNTDDKLWKSYHVKGITVNPVDWMYRKDIIRGWYSGNPCDSVRGDQYPWGWELTDYDDSNWKNAKWHSQAVDRGCRGHSGWLMVPRPVEILEHKVERFAEVRETTGIENKANFIDGKTPVIIPANSKVTFLIDHKVMSLGYPTLTLSKGKNSIVSVVYAETMYHEDGISRDRNQIDGKKLVGYDDVYITDGGDNRVYKPTWLRAFRYIKVSVETGSEELVIEDFYNLFTVYPLSEVGSFSSSTSDYKDIWDMNYRTVYICSQDYLMSDAYYETMQYAADARIHAMSLFYTTGNTDLWKQAIRHYDDSRTSDGLSLAAYPGSWNWIIPFFSLISTNMINDYFMHSGDVEFAKLNINGARSLFNWFEDHMTEQGILGKLEWSNPNHPGENGSFFTLAYAYTLRNIANTWKHIGLGAEAIEYEARADEICKSVYNLCYNADKGLLAETPKQEEFSARGQYMAILSGAIPQEDRGAVMTKALDMPVRGGSHEQFYLLQALNKAGLGDRFDETLAPYRIMLENGLSTCTEVPGDDARSDCHPWSTSPLIYYFQVVAGIKIEEPGFKKVSISPKLGELTEINSTCPTPLGSIIMDLERKGKKAITGTVTIPEGMNASFYWNGSEQKLVAGEQKINLK